MLLLRIADALYCPYSNPFPVECVLAVCVPCFTAISSLVPPISPQLTAACLSGGVSFRLVRPVCSGTLQSTSEGSPREKSIGPFCWNALTAAENLLLWPSSRVAQHVAQHNLLQGLSFFPFLFFVAKHLLALHNDGWHTLTLTPIPK